MSGKIALVAQEPDAVAVEADDCLCTMGRVPPLLDVDEVDAYCRSAEQIWYRGMAPKLLLTMEIVQPAVHAGEVLDFYLRNDPKWKGKPPVSSNLYKAIMVASEGRARPRQKIRKSLFVGKIFRCRTAKVEKGAASYTKIAEIVKKVAGA